MTQCSFFYLHQLEDCIVTVRAHIVSVGLPLGDLKGENDLGRSRECIARGSQLVDGGGSVSGRYHRHAITRNDKHFCAVLSQVQWRLATTIRRTRNAEKVGTTLSFTAGSAESTAVIFTALLAFTVGSAFFGKTSWTAVGGGMLAAKAIATVRSSIILIVADGKARLAGARESARRDASTKVVPTERLRVDGLDECSEGSKGNEAREPHDDESEAKEASEASVTAVKPVWYGWYGTGGRYSNEARTVALPCPALFCPAPSTINAA